MGLIDLTGDETVLCLLAHPATWRLRRIEHLDLHSATRYRLVTRHYCELPAGLPGLPPPAGPPPSDARLRVRLPVGQRKKGPLLNFSAAAAGGNPARLVRLEENTRIQAERLVRLRDAAPAIDAAAFPKPLLLAICRDVPSQWEAFLSHRWVAPPDMGVTKAMQAFLRASAGLKAPLGRVRGWRDDAARAGRCLAEVLDEREDLLCSSSENVLLAVAQLGSPYNDPAWFEAMVERYVDAVAKARGMGDEAEAFLRALATYGRRWEMMLDVELGLGERATIRVEEDRFFELEGRMRSTIVHRVAFRESRSVHVDAIATDHTVHIADLTLEDTKRNPVKAGPQWVDGDVTLGALGLARARGDTATVYAGTAPPAQVDVRIRLRPIRDVSLPPKGALLVTVAAIVLAAVVGGGKHGSDLADNLAVIVLPATVAAAFAVVREQSTLAMRLQRWNNAALGLAIVALWIVAAIRIV